MKRLLLATPLLALVACSAETTESASSPSQAPSHGSELPSAPSDILGQASTQTPQSQPTSRPVDPNAVAVTVNGEAIHERDLEQRMMQMLSRNGMTPPPMVVQQMRESLRPQALQQAVESKLLEQAVVEAGVTTDEAELMRELENNLNAMLFQNKMTREELGEQIQASQNMALEAYIKQEASSEAFRDHFLQIKFFETLYPEETTITEEEIAERYQQDLETIFTAPDLVQASHILIGVDAGADVQAKATAKSKADEVLALCRAEGADFGALAQEHSTGPSAPRGGALGYFRREGQMVEPFAAAAFALDVGGISDVVETQFGYHIIQVTGKKASEVTPLEQASPIIRGQIRLERASTLRAEHMKKLRDEAEIVYPS